MKTKTTIMIAFQSLKDFGNCFLEKIKVLLHINRNASNIN